MILDFTITTCLRPEILRRTLDSFRENLRGVEWGKCKAFVNVDPVGPGNVPEVCQVLCDHFSAELHAGECSGDMRCPDEPNFARAVKWCFAQPQTPFAFHAEDDWLLTDPIEIEDMVKAMGSRSVLNLRAHPFSQQTRRCYLSPALWRTAMMHAVSEQMNEHDNPEIQLWRITDAEQCGKYWPHNIVLKDIGREWLASSGFKKNVEVTRGINPFTHWTPR